MRPDPIGDVGIRAGHVDGDGGDNTVALLDGGDRLLGQLVTQEQIAQAQHLDGAEAELVAPAHEQRVLECSLDAPIDEVEAVVLAARNARDLRGAALQIRLTCICSPQVLRAVRRVGLEPGHTH